jgi:ATP-dependent helicase YprA (DUF1998 family)
VSLHISGKSLCFNLGIFEHLLGNRNSATALSLFPLNALAKDQEEKLNQLNDRLPQPERLKIVCLTGACSNPFAHRRVIGGLTVG